MQCLWPSSVVLLAETLIDSWGFPIADDTENVVWISATRVHYFMVNGDKLALWAQSFVFVCLEAVLEMRKYMLYSNS